MGASPAAPGTWCRRRGAMAMLGGALPRLLLLALLGFLQLALGCVDGDRDALLGFKAGLADRAGILRSWDATLSCCGWAGVRCGAGGRVVELDLDGSAVTAVSARIVPPPGPQNFLHRLEGVREPDLLGRTLGNLTALRALRLSGIDLGPDVFPTSGFFSRPGPRPQLRILSLPGLNLGGSIPGAWGGLRDLRYLNLSGNAFRGGIPSQLCGASLLEVLDVSAPDHSPATAILSGPVPACAAQWSALRALVASGNALSGPIPSFLHLFRNLQVLKLDHNRLVGAIPTSLGSLVKLKVLHLQGNAGLSGAIPSTLGLLRALEELRLGGSGDEPEEVSEKLESEAQGLGGLLPGLELWRLARLKVLHIRGTSLRGSIPAALGNLSLLEDLRLDFNLLSGVIPAALGKLGSLEHLFLRYNRLGGGLPSSLGRLAKLQDLYLNHNLLGGAIPDSFVNLTLRTINLSSNRLNGTIPSGLGLIGSSEIYDTRILDLSWNRLSGQFPASLLASGLSHIYLSHNLLSSLPLGPVAFSEQPELELAVLSVDFNGLAGLLPPWVFQLPSLLTLDLSHNLLVSPFPAFAAESFSIVNLNLSSNRFSGHLPDFLTQLLGVALLDFSNNRFDGPIPPNIGGTLTAPGEESGLEILDLSRNRLSGQLPPGIFNVLQGLRLAHNYLSGAILASENETIVDFDIQFLDLSYNNFVGPIPPQLATSRLQKVLLAGNKLSGTIPDFSPICPGLLAVSFAHNLLTGHPFPGGVKNCTNLVSYDVSWNSLTGSLPRELASWQALRVLDVSHNRLGGIFPDFIASLRALEYLDVSHNTFAGPLPLARFNAFPAIQNATQDQGSSFGLGAVSLYLYQNVVLLLVQPTLDFSANLFTGDISPNLGSLRHLSYFNISRNRVQHIIPDSLARISALQVLDVSRNHLTGRIPFNLTHLNFLRLVDFSYNNLSGPIPQSAIWSKFPASSFTGNRLCGPPISDSCLA